MKGKKDSPRYKKKDRGRGGGGEGGKGVCFIIFNMTIYTSFSFGLSVKRLSTYSMKESIYLWLTNTVWMNQHIYTNTKALKTDENWKDDQIIDNIKRHCLIITYKTTK